MPESLAAATTALLDDRPAPPRTARVAGLGHKLPERVVPNGPIAERIGVDADWIVRRTGIRERRYAAPDERTSDLAVPGRPPRAHRRRPQAAGRRPRPRRDDDAGRADAEHGPARRRSARHRRRRLRRRRRLHRLAVRAQQRRRPDRDRPLRRRARDRRGDPEPRHQPGRQAHRLAVRRRRRRGRAERRGRGRDRPDRARLRRQHGRHDHRHRTPIGCSSWTATRRSTRPSRCSPTPRARRASAPA